MTEILLKNSPWDGLWFLMFCTPARDWKVRSLRALQRSVIRKSCEVRGKDKVREDSGAKLASNDKVKEPVCDGRYSLPMKSERRNEKSAFSGLRGFSAFLEAL